MPIYEYRCPSCGNTFELIQSITDDKPQQCPQCKGQAHRIMSLSSFQLKGTGWYATDYKDKDKSKTFREKKKATGEKAGEKKETKTDKKTKKASAA